MQDTMESRYADAQLWAREAGRITLKYFQDETLQVDRKGDDSPVTAGDRDSETYLREMILDKYPRDSIVGEEFGEHQGESDFRWILDPIDGTKSFIHGVPLYGTLVGVECEGRPEIGVIEIPGLDERVHAMRGGGAWLQRGNAEATRASVSGVKELSQAMLVTTGSRSFASRDAAAVYDRLDASVRLTRTWGDCYGYLLVAVGRADIMIDPYLNVWDAAAVAPVLNEAGGEFVDWRGEASIRGGDGIGANRELLEQVVEITRSYPAPS
jgi:histidinol-phosphatase